ncbi:MAG TPA: phosphoribosylaminoimidazolesuccinocarboxamide synthase, partial [Actinocrinis sp.]|uniref:phosphoribosylaminoimidazolesuccinocarboxamide synthase n=1 Tax=Actinocrinis sp. TaxID=1920516 RepID=UPI002DDD18CE
MTANPASTPGRANAHSSADSADSTGSVSPHGSARSVSPDGVPSSTTPGSFAGAVHLGSGKVRELYAVDDRLLLVASDRISAYDYILQTPIPDKGRILTQLSLWW